MNAQQQQLWSQLSELELEDPASAFTFTGRLAKENGWKMSFARRVVEEYRRFLFLAGAADHSVSPPDALDQAWHLHLLYTRSYWDDLCGKILKRPLHHEPTRGGSEETAKFGGWYARTLASYHHFFGEPPPQDIWPSPESMARKEAVYRRVNVSRYLLVPKLHLPRWMRRSALAPAAALAVFGLPAGLLAAETINFLDWHGPDFLKLYVPVVIVAILCAVAVRYLLLPDRAADSQQKELSADETAYLAGGAQTAIGAALGSLVQSGAVEIRTHPAVASARQTLHVGQAPSGPLPPLQQEVLRVVKADPGLTIDSLRRTLLPVTEPVRSSLEQKGLVYNESSVSLARMMATAPLVVVALLGLLKFGVGLSRESPVLLLALCLAAVGVAIFLAARRAFRTSAGVQKLDSMRQQFSALETQVKEHAPLPAGDLGLALGLFGFGLLAGGPGTILADTFHSPRRDPSGNWTDSGSSCSSGCSSSSGDSGGSSCGGGDGGGGGCGGGGCGGCGGGGD